MASGSRGSIPVPLKLSDGLLQSASGRLAVSLCFSSRSWPSGREKCNLALHCGQVPCRSSASLSASSALTTATEPSAPTALSERTLQLPIDYYQVLGAQLNDSADAIFRAYEARVENPPTEGFSLEALESREEILRIACETLADRDLRYEYDSGLKEDETATVTIDVPWSKLAGALCVLQEVGEVDVVLQVGQALLDERLIKPHRQDIVLAVALAYIQLSREALSSSSAVVRSYDMLNAALRLLQNEGGRSFAPGLQAQISESLEEITPPCVLELLALPLDEEHKLQREEGLQVLRNVLWTTAEGGFVRSFNRERFMREAFSRMTSDEQVALFTETPTDIPAEKLEVYSVALAHVAEGFLKKKPHFIQEANSLFSQLEESLPKGTMSDERRDIMLGKGLTALLLGEVQSCRDTLGLDDSTAWNCPSVLEFVTSNSEGEDVLPGMCKLLESWLSEEVFENFRNTVGSTAKLADYYDDPEVLSYLENLERESPLEAAAAIVRIGAALDSVKMKLQKVFPLGRKPSRADALKDASIDTSSELQLVKAAQQSGKMQKSSSKQGGLRALQVACIGAVVGSSILAGIRYRDKVERFLYQELPAITASLTQERTEAGEVKRMDARLAEEMIRKWQIAKAQALGDGHQYAQLPEILDGQMLRSWSERAAEVAKQGWHWDYKLLDLSVESVTISEDGRRATVEATLQEAARLFDEQRPEHNDAYTSSYTTRYELTHGKQGWRITDGVVLRT